MITRIWHGRTKSEHSQDYLNYIQKTGLKDYLDVNGNISAKILMRTEGDICHFWTISEWNHISSIKDFCGDKIEKPRYYPEDKKYLLELEETVIHCETFKNAKKALLVIDVQEGFFINEEKEIFKEELLVKNINILINSFREYSYPVIFIRHTEGKGEILELGSNQWKIYSKIETRETDIFIDKKTPDSFLGTNLEQLLYENNIDEIFITGLQTDFCIDTTCRSAFSKKVKTVLVTDSHSTHNNKFMSAKEIIGYHNFLLEKWFVTPQSAKEVVMQFRSREF